MAAIANVETAFAQRDLQDIVLHDIKSRAVLGGGFEDRLPVDGMPGLGPGPEFRVLQEVRP